MLDVDETIVWRQAGPAEWPARRAAARTRRISRRRGTRNSKRLLPRGYCAAAWDMPGYGASAAIEPLTFEALADAVGRWLDALGAESRAHRRPVAGRHARPARRAADAGRSSIAGIARHESGVRVRRHDDGGGVARRTPAAAGRWRDAGDDRSDRAAVDHGGLRLHGRARRCDRGDGAHPVDRTRGRRTVPGDS